MSRISSAVLKLRHSSRLPPLGQVSTLLDPSSPVCTPDQRSARQISSSAAAVSSEPPASPVLNTSPWLPARKSQSHVAEVHKLCKIIGERDWDRALESALERSGVRLSAIHVVDVIKMQENPKHALKFFIWAGQQRGYEHNAYAINAIRRVWGHEKDLDAFIDIISRMHSEKYAWTASKFLVLIEGYGWAGLVDAAVDVLDKMESLGFRPNEKHYGCLLNALLKENQFQTCQAVLKRMKKRCDITLDVVTYTLLIDGCCKGGQIHVACEFFEEMLRAGVEPNLLTYSALFDGLCKANEIEKGLRVYREMKVLDLDMVALNILLAGLCENNHVETAYDFFCEMINKGHKPVARTYSILLDGLSKVNRFQDAEKLVEEALGKGIELDISTCGRLIENICFEGRATEACDLMSKLSSNGGIPDVTCTAVFDRLCKNGKAYKAFNLWNTLRSKQCLSTETYQILLDGLCMEGRLIPAKQVYLDMINKGHVPSVGVHCALLNGFCRAGSFDEAYKVMAEMTERGCVPNADIFNSLIHGFAKAKKMPKALEVLEKMEAADCIPTVFTYTALINGFCKTETPEAALIILQKMAQRGFVPDIATYNTLITELCRVQKADGAYNLLLEMKEKGLTPSISSYNVLITTLCELGKVEEAHELLLQVLETSQTPNSLACESLLNGLRSVGRYQDASTIFDRLNSRT